MTTQTLTESQGRSAAQTGTAPLEPLAYNTQQTCLLLGGISTVTLWRLTVRGLIRPIKGVRHRLYSRREIERFIAVNTKSE